ncbi:hypothetical protein I4U23_014712 [Adineta vaga]|nr:hypothetical protein I4U23_014712 [Adineta vaga]
MAVVKANGYGHGMLEIAKVSLAAGATWLGVVTLDEALVLRSKVSLDIPILILGYVAPQHLHMTSRYVARLARQPFNFHLKIDTGLNKLGCKTIDEVKAVLKIVALHSYRNMTEIFTHFSTSENVKNTSFFQQQLTKKPFFNMVRLGKALTSPPNEGLKHLLPITLQTSDYTTTQSQWIGTISIGYADGCRQQYRSNISIVADEIAEKVNQLTSKVFTSLSSRLPRIYTENGSIICVLSAEHTMSFTTEVLFSIIFLVTAVDCQGGGGGGGGGAIYGLGGIVFILIFLPIYCCCAGKPRRSNAKYVHASSAQNEESKVIDIKLFQSGLWQCEYFQYDKQHGPYYINLAFDNIRFEVTGSGFDDVGTYTLHGFYSTETRRLGITKTYEAGTGNPKENLGHNVIIQLEWNRLNHQFEGKWYVRTRKFKGSGIYKLRMSQQELSLLSVYEKV